MVLALTGLGCEPSRGGKGTTGGTTASGSAAVEVVPPKVEEPSKEAIDTGIGKPGGTLTTAMISDPKTFNYYLSQETSSSTPLLFAFEGMAEINAITGKVQPALAESWEISSDNLTYTFTL